MSPSSILLIGSFVFPLILEVWRLGAYSLSIRLCWESGFGDMLSRERLSDIRL
jgi:hypothetical protein